MAGKKGRSGRRSHREELLTRDVEKIATEIVHRGLTTDILDEKEKMRIAADIFRNTQKRVVEHSGSFSFHKMIEVAHGDRQEASFSRN